MILQVTEVISDLRLYIKTIPCFKEFQQKKNSIMWLIILGMISGAIK